MAAAANGHGDPLAATIRSFDPQEEPANTGARWERWLRIFDTYLIARQIKEDAVKSAQLLLRAGPEVFDIYETLRAADDKYADVVKKLSEYFKPMKDTAVAVYVFRGEVQKAGETVDKYVTRLKTLAKHCEFADSDNEIRAQILQNTCNGKLRREILKHPDWKLADVLKEARSIEASEARATDMETDRSMMVNHVAKKSSGSSSYHPKKKVSERKHDSYAKKKVQARGSAESSKCFKCGNDWPHEGGMDNCPAKNRRCNKCHQKGHYRKLCPEKPEKRKHSKSKAYRVTEEDSDDDEDDGYVFSVGKSTGLPHVMLKVQGVSVPFLVDTGASVDIIDSQTYRLIGDPPLKKTKRKVYSYNSGESIPAMGQVHCGLESKDRFLETDLLVVKADSAGNLLSHTTACSLGLVKLSKDIVVYKASTEDTGADKWVKKFPSVFSGIGKLREYQAHIHVNPDVNPVIQPTRRVPFHLRQKVEQEILRLKEADIIEEAEGPTKWLSPAVFVEKKSGSIRLCVDSRRANEAVVRERYQGPTIHELVHDLNGAKVFSTIDMREGFHQIELDKESRDITTFSTHIGNFRYKRLIYGISAAPELFQKLIQQTIADIPNCRNIADDIIVYGKNQSEHDECVSKLLSRLQDKGLTLRREKCQFNQNAVTFYGFRWEGGKLKPDPVKVAAIEKLQQPEDVTQLRSVLGMTNYCARFIPKYSDITAPLRDLTHQDVPWKWGPEQEGAFQKLKEVLTQKPSLSYFDPKKETIILTDASPVGISAILTQVDNGIATSTVVAYASRALSPVEQRYPQTDREALGVVWACEHFHMYVYGKPFQLLTDHKALVQIFGNAKLKTTVRLEKYALRLSPYQVTVKYRPGHDNPADYMSRDPLPDDRTESEREVDFYVNYVATNSVPKTIMFEEIKTATIQDPTLQEVYKRICDGKWHEPVPSGIDGNIVDRFRNIKEELCASTEGDFLLRGTRLVIPESLQGRILALAHEGHLGLTKMKQLLREKVWFPYIDRAAEAVIKNCLACQAATVKKNNSDPPKMSILPGGVWQEVSVDFWGPTPDGDYVLLLVDEYSRYPVAELVRSTSADVVIPVLDKVFSEWGIPFVLKSDNGPPFQSEKFRNFCDYMGIKHRKITPLWPKANAEAERFMQNIGKVVTTSVVECKVWKQELYKFLRNYRSVPHPSTCRAPAVLMLNRPVRIKLPAIGDRSVPGWDSQIREEDRSAKNKMADYKVGKKVLLKLKKENKYTPRFDPEFYTVVSAKGTMITAKRGRKTVTRNMAFFKPYIGDQTYQKQKNSDIESYSRSDEVTPSPTPVVTTAPLDVPVEAPVVTPPSVTTPVRASRRSVPVDGNNNSETINTPVRRGQAPPSDLARGEGSPKTIESPKTPSRSKFGRVQRKPVWMKDYEK